MLAPIFIRGVKDPERQPGRSDGAVEGRLDSSGILVSPDSDLIC